MKVHLIFDKRFSKHLSRNRMGKKMGNCYTYSFF